MRTLEPTGFLPHGAPARPEAPFPEMPANLRRPHTEEARQRVDALVDQDRQRHGGTPPMDPTSNKTIAAPAAGSKLAQIRALKETKNTPTKPDAPAPVKPTTAPEKPKADTPTKESTVRKTTTAAKKKPATKTKPKGKPAKKAARTKPTPAARPARAATPSEGKGEKLIASLTAGWTTMAQIEAATGWQPHTARAFLSRLRKPVKDGGRGLKVEHDKDKGYRIA